jgi:transcriptional regulator with PAS, ATPase and Fis domain
MLMSQPFPANPFPHVTFISDCVGQAKRLVTGAAQQVLDLFQQYSWPGNIRELRNVVKRGVFTGKTEWIRQEDLPFDVAQRLATPAIEARRP